MSTWHLNPLHEGINYIMKNYDWITSFQYNNFHFCIIFLKKTWYLSTARDCFFQCWLFVFANIASEPQLQGTGSVTWWDSHSLVRVLSTCGHQIHGAGRVWSEWIIEERHRVHWPWLRDEGRRLQFTPFLAFLLFYIYFAQSLLFVVFGYFPAANLDTNINMANHLFALLCGVDVSCETPPSRLVLRVLLWQTLLQPPPLWSSYPSFPRHLHPHHSLPYVFVFSSRNMPIPLQPTLLHFLGYFSHFCRPSNSFIPNSVHLGDSTHPS